MAVEVIAALIGANVAINGLMLGLIIRNCLDIRRIKDKLGINGK